MSASSQLQRRIFIVGAPRSGTTLLQSLLAAHSELTSFTETHFFSRDFRALPTPPYAALRRNPTPRLMEFLAENGVDPSSGELPERIERLRAILIPPLHGQTAALELLGALDDLTLERGAAGWVEKTPRHLRYLRFLEHLPLPGPRPRFVHIIRNGADVVKSLHQASRHWPRAYSVEECVRRWNRDMAISLRRARGARDEFVFYEELVRRPEIVLQRLFESLRLPWEPGIVERYAENASGLVTPDETWKANVDRGVLQSARTQVAPASKKLDELASLQKDLYAQLAEATRDRRRSEIQDA